jgi:DNA-binding transcriptional regulator YiaG
MPTQTAPWTPGIILHLRKRLGLSQADFAERLGTTRQTIINWERGHQVPKKMASRLLSALTDQVDRGEGSHAEVSDQCAGQEG